MYFVSFFNFMIPLFYISFIRLSLVLMMCLAFTGHSILLAQDLSSGSDITKLGGDLTSRFIDRTALQVAAPNVTDPIRRNAQLQGFSTFHRILTRGEGLGPKFNSASCGDCHINNGRGLDVRRPKNSSILIKVA